MLFRSNDTATTEIYTVPYTLSLHDALPISLLLLLPLLLLPSPPPPPQETSMAASSKATTRLISRTTLHITDPSAPLGIVSVISKTLLRGAIIRMDLRGLTAPASNASGNQAVATGGE